MAYVTENTYTGNGSTVLYSFTFPYLETTDIKVTVAEAARTQGSGSTQWTLPNATQIQFNTAPTNGQAIRIYRDTNIDNLKAEFFAGSAIRSQDLNEDFLQNLYNSQEAEAAIADKWNNSSDTLDSTEAFVDSNDKIMTAAAIDDRINANIASQPLADGKIFAGNGSGVAAAVTPSGDVTMANTGAFTIANLSVENGMIANDAINGAKIANDAIDSEHYAADSIDTEHYAPGSVDTTAIADGTIVNTDISGSAGIAHSKLASLTDGRILVGNGSNVPVGVTVSGDVTMANDGAVTIANDAVEQTMIADDAVGADQLAANAVVNASVAAGAAITLAKLEPLDNTKIIVGNASNVATEVTMSGDATIASTGAVTIANDAVEQAMIADDAVGADQLASNAVVNDSVAASAAIAHSKLANVTDGRILVGNGSNVPTAVAVSGDVTIANTGAVTIANDAVEIGMIGCEQTTITDSDSHIPTSGAVVDYVAAQINPIGGLEVIADDESFPNTIPAAGVVISITDAAGLSINSSGVSTNGDTLDNSTVTINGFPSALRGGVGSNADPYVLGAGSGLMVQSTGSSHTYNYHKALLKESDYVQLSDDINDFNARYRVAADASGVRTGQCGSNGTGSGSYPCDGDMCWFTGASKMYVFDAPAASTSNSDLDAAWKEVTSAGDYKILTVQDNGEAVSGNGPTFDGPSGSTTQYDLFDGNSNASITSAQQLIVVLNGVIQKPNSGTYSGSEEGFYLDGSNGIRFCDPPPSGSTLFVTQIGTATTLSTPGTGSISNANMFAAGVINAAAIGSGVIPGDATGVDFNDNVKTRFGTDNDAYIYYAGASGGEVGDTTDSLTIRNPDGKIYVRADEFMLTSDDTGGRAIYTDNDNDRLELGFDGWHNIYCSQTTTTLHKDVIFDNPTNAGKDITWDHSADSLIFADNTKAKFGTGSDLEIYHDATDNQIKSTNGKVVITTTADNSDIDIIPNGTGNINLDADTVRVGDNNADAVITSYGTGNLKLATNNDGTGGYIQLTQGTNGGIQLQCAGTGDIQAIGDTLQVGDQNADATITTFGTGDLTLSTNGGTDSGTIEIEDGANNDIIITPNGSGDVIIDGLKYPQAAGSAGQFLRANASDTSQLEWATVSSAPEGEAVLSTTNSNEASTKFLRADGDGTCSWQIPPAATSTSGTDNFTVSDGNLIIGTSGHGIDFSAYANASWGSGASTANELLHHYEVGTFTPYVTGGGTSFDHTGTHGHREGDFVRVGELVHVYVRVGWNNTNSASGGISVKGFPYRCKPNTSGYYQTGAFVDFWGFFPDGYSCLMMTGNQDYCTIGNVADNGAAALNTGHISTGNGGFSFGFTYSTED